MARAGAARRMKRDAKKEFAKATRGKQKYKDQKGGVTPSKGVRKGMLGKKRRRQEARDAEDDNEEAVRTSCARRSLARS